MKQYDAIVIGAGQGGVPLSKRLAKAGWKVLLVERRLIGGTCINDGCTPTKAMIASAKLAHMAVSSKDLGVSIPDHSIDLSRIIERKNGIVERFRKSTEQQLSATENLDVILGEATFTGRKMIDVKYNEGNQTASFTAGKIFINIGCHTFIPGITGLENVPYLTSTTILDIDQVPEHLLIVGGGYVAMELGQMFRRFGSLVTIIEHSPVLLKHEDEDIAKAIEDFMTEEDIVIYTGAEVKQVEQTAKEKLVVTLAIKNSKQLIACSHLLIAPGRKPSVKELNLEATGVQLDEKGFIKTDDHLQTNVEGIYALGDVKGGPAFTHISYNDYIVLADNILYHKEHNIKNRLVPYCMFTDPQLGRVGMTEKQAIEKGYKIKVAKLPMKSTARGIETGHTKGLMKAVVDADSKKILGVAILGEEGGETMSVLQMAMMAGFTYPQLRNTMFAHPLYAESINNLFMTLDEKA